MKRTALNRKTPLRAKARLTSKGRIKPRSAKTANLYRDLRIPLVIELLEAHPVCQWPLGCHEAAVDCHELTSRARGGSVTDKANIVTACRTHHDYVTTNPKAGQRIGWVLPRTPDQWKGVKKWAA